ncbi:hypothetical protein [Streptomyces sp. NPDC058678]|uniref:hypothetical protein n=1 Tax=Streptomyces sp. NPDC058678 TaxID=3346595 RepID=UPI00364F5F00
MDGTRVIRRRTSPGGARGRAALLACAALVAGLLQVAAVPAAHADDMPHKPSPGVPVAGHSGATKVPRASDGLPHHPTRAPKRSWARPGSVTVTLPAAHSTGSAVRAGSLPVTLTVPAAAKTAKTSKTAQHQAAPLAGPATVRVLDQKTTRAAGVDGLLFTVTPRPAASGATVGVRVDDSGYAQAYGGTHTFDNTAGRTLTTDDHGDVSTAADDRCTRTTYVDNSTAWILDDPSRIQTLSVACTATPDYTKDVLSDIRTAYDGQAYATAPTAGDATHVATLKSHDATTATYLESGAAYDSYGRATSTTDLTGNVTATETGTPQRTDRTDGRVTTTVYTPSTGFPTTVAVTTPPANRATRPPRRPARRPWSRCADCRSRSSTPTASAPTPPTTRWAAS